MTFFKPSGKYYMEEDFEIPDGTYGWDIPKELKKIEKFRRLVKANDGIGFTAFGLLTNEVPFKISPSNF